MARRRVVERRRNGALHIHHVIVAEPIEFAGCYPGFDVRGNEVKHFGGKTAGQPHFFDIFGGFEGYVHEFNSLPKNKAEV